MSEKVKEVRAKISNAYTLLGILGVFCLVVFIIFSATNYYAFRDQLVYKEQMQLLTIAETTARSLTSYVDEKTEDMRILRNLLRENAITANPQNHDDQMAVILQNYFEVQKGEIQALQLVSQDGEPIITVPEKSERVFGGYNQPAYVESQGKVSSIYEDTDEHYFILLKESVSMRNGKQAFLLMRIDLNTMYELLIKDIRAGDKGYASVKDSKGVLLMHPKKEDIGTNVMIARKTEFPDYDWSELEKLVELQMKGESGVGIYHSIWYHDEKRDRIKKFSAFSPSYIGDDFWIVTVSMDYNELVGIVNRHYYSSMTLMALVALFLGVMSLYVFALKRNLREIEIEHDYVDKLNVLNTELESDLKKRQKLERELLKSQRKFMKLFNTGSHLTFVVTAPTDVDQELKILEVNDYACERLGFEREAIQRMKYTDLDPSFLEHLPLSEVQMVDSMSQLHFETTLYGADQKQFPTEIYAHYFRMDNKPYLMFLARDITEKKANEATMEKNQGLLIYKSRLAAMGEMIANIAHQWRQPLSSLTLMISNIEDAYDHNELDEAYFREQIANSQKIIQDMSTVIDDFRYFFNPKDEKQVFNPHQQIQSTMEMLSDRIKINEVDIRIVEQDKVELFGYASQFSQVLLNIVNNSIDALKNRENERRIKICVRRQGTYAELIIQDNGGGVSEAHLPKLFDPYYSTKNKDAGTGIGLYMTKLIIERNFEGTIKVQNFEDGLLMQLMIPMKGELDGE